MSDSSGTAGAPRIGVAFSSRRRVVVVAVLAIVIALVTVADHRPDASPASAQETPRNQMPGVVMPVAFPAGSLASTWFCAGGTASKDGFADHTVVIANPTDAPVTATVTAYPGTLATDANADQIAQSAPPPADVKVPARSRVSVHLADMVEAPYVAALVEAPGGELVVEHQVRGPGGTSTAPCATTGSAVWHFAAGSVTQSTGEVLTLFNPFPEKAVVDVRFATSDGFRSPPDYQSLPIPAGGLVVVDVFAAVARHDQVSATAQAKSGRIVADRIVNYGGPPRGLSLGLGAPEPAPSWWFPDGHSGDGLSDTYVVYNPSDAPAEVDVDVALDHPETNGEVDPVPVTVEPHSYTLVATNDQQRVPAGVGHHVAVRSRNGVPIVAERHFVSADPAPQTGVTDTLGAPLAGTHWVLAGTVSDTATQEFVVVANPSSDSIARVRLVGFANGRFVPIEGLDAVEVAPNGRVVIDLGALTPADQLPLVLTSSQPVVVEQSLYTIDGPGLSAAIGVPLADGTGMLPE